jgi:hypothetical protein
MKLFKYVIVAAVFIVEKSMAELCYAGETWDADTNACVKCPEGMFSFFSSVGCTTEDMKRFPDIKPNVDDRETNAQRKPQIQPTESTSSSGQKPTAQRKPRIQ